MKFILRKIALFGGLMLCSTWLSAADSSAGQSVDAAVEKKLSAALAMSSTGLSVESVKTSEIPGLYAVQFLNGPLVYANESGSHFVVGDMFMVEGDSFVNIAEQRRDIVRKEMIDGVDTSDMIVFSPASEPKASITVFTDVTCFYCQKLHKEVPALNKAGVQVRYLAYPRSGLGSAGYRQLASAWCNDNPKEALTMLKNKKSVADNVCAGNPVADQYQLGQEMGVRGTPAIVIDDSGQMIPGYQSADELMVTLGLN